METGLWLRLHNMENKATLGGLMNKNLIWLALPALLASCSLFGSDDRTSTSPSEGETQTISITTEKVDLSKDLDALESGSDWGNDRSGIVSKTVEWSSVSTPAQASFLGRTVVIDQVRRDDADDFYGIRIRLGNRTATTVALEYLFRFYDSNGQALASLHEGYRPVSLTPRGTDSVFDSARSRGAVGFRLFLRKRGTSDVGYPDADLTWLNGPQDVTTWLNGMVFVDNLFQDNPAGTNRVMFRLGANTVEPITIEYRIIFYDERENSIRSDHGDFRLLTLSADKESAILNTCRRPGATGYRLYIRAADSGTEGMDDQSVPNNQ